MKKTRWVACSRDASYSASLQRHLLPEGSLTTLCGCTASMPEVWRGNTKKPMCAGCLMVQEREKGQ